MRRARELQFDLLDVVVVDVAITAGPNELAHIQPRLLRQHGLSRSEDSLAAGLPRESLLLDPGLGFAKNARQSLELCARLDELCALGFPVLVGPSRKSFVARAAMEGREGPLPPPEARLGGTIAATITCVAQGARVVRTHDVAPVRQALAVAEALRGAAGKRARPASASSEGARHA